MEAFKCCDKCTICKGNLDSSLFTVHFMPPPVLSMFAKRTHAIAEKLRVGGTVGVVAEVCVAVIVKLNVNVNIGS